MCIRDSYKGFCDKIKVAIEKREVLRMMTIREYKRAESLEEAWPVSYTHLDVYKRQGQGPV